MRDRGGGRSGTCSGKRDEGGDALGRAQRTVERRGQDGVGSANPDGARGPAREEVRRDSVVGPQAQRKIRAHVSGGGGRKGGGSGEGGGRGGETTETAGRILWSQSPQT